ncbi:MAG: hypothetical protein AB7O65_07495 [Candidatus Korobacteraceae bacterium]
MNRRTFVGTLAAGVAASAQLVAAQEKAAPAKAGKAEAPVKTWSPKIERLFKVEGLVHPNAMEATPDGMWLGDQVSEKIFKVDWKTGKVLTELQSESHNTSGVAIGEGFLWLSANGSVNNRRPPRPQDKPYGELVQADMKTGKTIKIHKVIWGGGIHGMTYVPQTNSLWVTALSLQAVAELDTRDNMRIKRMFPAKGTRAHGLDWDNGAMWVVFAGEREVHKFDISTGKVLEVVKLSPTADPDPHGMCIHEGHMYYCDAGLTESGPGSERGMVCRFKLNGAT